MENVQVMDVSVNWAGLEFHATHLYALKIVSMEPVLPQTIANVDQAG